MNPVVIQATLDKFSSGTVYLDANGVIQGCNSAWRELANELNWNHVDDAVGHAYDASDPRVAAIPFFQEKLSDVLEGQAHECRVHVLCGTDGEQRVLEIYAKSCDGEDPGVLVHHQERLFMSRNSSEWVSQDYMELLFEKLSSGVIFRSASGEVELVNHAATQILGLTFEQIFNPQRISSDWTVTDELGQKLEPENYPGALALRHASSRMGSVMGIRQPGFGLKWIRVDSQLVHDQGGKKLLGVLSSITDISLERQSQEEIKAITDRLQLALEGAKIGIWDWYIEERTMVWDERMYALYGVDSESDIPLKEVWEKSASPIDRVVINKLMAELKAGREEASTQFCITLPDGNIRYLRSQARAVRDVHNKVYRVVGINWDVSKEVEQEQRLKEIAFQDELTGLPNRIAFNFQLNKMIARARKESDSFAVLVLDLDHFKDINDSFGHPTGDTLLLEVVNCIHPLIKPNYQFFRLGGDEFTLILSAEDEKAGYLDIAKKIQSALSEPIYLLDGPAISVKVSMGLSMYPGDATDAVGLIRAADLAMHNAKEEGRDRIIWYDRGMTRALKSKVDMENKLREAIRDEEFNLFYQPILDLHSLKVVGCEALIRWPAVKGEYISPLDFIPVAESSGLIEKLGVWINQTAIQQFKLWKVIHSELEYVSVNVSPHQLQCSSFVEDILDLVKYVGVPPSCVQLEITEGTFLHETEGSNSHLNALKNEGFRLAIDDFGTGYSSLSYLKRFNVDVIKIDKSFVDDIETSQTDRDIVEAILAMTKSLGFQTLVEGIERKEQAELVRAMGCGYGQGYFYGRPTNADQFAETYIGLTGNSDS